METAQNQTGTQPAIDHFTLDFALLLHTLIVNLASFAESVQGFSVQSSGWMAVVFPER